MENGKWKTNNEERVKLYLPNKKTIIHYPLSIFHSSKSFADAVYLLDGSSFFDVRNF